MPKREPSFRIFGTVTTRETGRPVPNLIVEALDKDLIFDDRLGSVITDRQGRFEIRYQRSDFQELFFDRKPDVYLRVRRADGTIILTTKDRVRYDAGRTEAFQILVPEKELDTGGTTMENVVKLVLDLSDIKDDPELGEELLKSAKPIKVAAVRQGAVLVSTEIETKKIKDFSKVPVTLKFDFEGEQPPGVYITIGPNLPDREFLAIETRKLWVSPRQFIEFKADLSAEKLYLPKYLFKRWLFLCRSFTITGRVVKNVDGCSEPVPGAVVEAFDVDCWWFWWRRDLVASATTNPDGSFEMTFTWCCLLPILYPKPPYVIDPDLLRHLTEAIRPHVGPIPPEVLKDPKIFEDFLAQGATPEPIPSPIRSVEVGRDIRLPSAGLAASPTLPLPPPRSARASLDISAITDRALSEPVAALVEKLRPILPPWWPCWPFRHRDCTPDIVFRVTQVCAGEERVIYDEGPFQTRWNIPTDLDVTLYADEDACSIPICEEPPLGGSCLKYTKVNCYDVANLGTDSGPPDLRGYLNPGSTDNPFAGTIRMRGLFGAGSDIDYFKPQYDYNGGGFTDFPPEALVTFTRRYWAPPPASPPGTPSQWNDVTFKPDPVDGIVVYKTRKKAEEENPLPPGWTWGYLWNDFDTLFYWRSQLLEGDGLYTIRLIGYRWDSATNSLIDEGVMQTCEMQVTNDELVMVRIDNRLADDPTHPSTPTHPCGAGTIHLCTYEPDCDFVQILQIKNPGTSTEETIAIGACDVIQLADTDHIVVRFLASDADGHLLGYHMHAHWKESSVFNVVSAGTLEHDPDRLVGPRYAHTFLGAQGVYRAGLLPADPEHDHPFWYGGNFKVTVPGSAFLDTCAYTLMLRVWKRTIVGCQNPYYVHVNRCSYSFTIEKV